MELNCKKSFYMHFGKNYINFKLLFIGITKVHLLDVVFDNLDLIKLKLKFESMYIFSKFKILYNATKRIIWKYLRNN